MDFLQYLLQNVQNSILNNKNIKHEHACYDFFYPPPSYPNQYSLYRHK